MREDIGAKLSALKSSYYFNEAKKCKNPEQQMYYYDKHLAEKVIEQRRHMIQTQKKIMLEDILGSFQR